MNVNRLFNPGRVQSLRHANRISPLAPLSALSADGYKPFCVNNKIINNKTIGPWLQCHRLLSSSTSDDTSQGSCDNNTNKNMTASTPPPSSQDSASPLDGLKRTIYVHPLSQIILEYLQDCHHDWVVYHGLDQSLTVHRDGSFELKFPHQDPREHADENDEAATSINNESDDIAQSNPESIKSDNPVDDKIWTSYDGEEKKHWLTVHKQSLHQRFLLQDNLLPAWHGNKKSLPERIHLSVDAMIREVDRLDAIERQHQQQRHKK